jgi:two-component system, NtrC family, sensor kinase
MEINKWILTSLIQVFLLSASAQSIIVSDEKSLVENFGKQVQIYEDKTNSLEMSSVAQSASFDSCLNSVPNFHVSKSTFWVKFNVINLSTQDFLVLDVAQPALDEVSLISFKEGIMTEQYLSDKSIVDSRWLHNQNYCFKLDLKPGETGCFYLKIKSGDQIQIPTRIGTLQSIVNLHSQKDLWFGIYCGVFISIILMNLFVYFRTKERNYLEYIAYIFVLLLTQCNFQGYTLRYLWPKYPGMERFSVFIFSALVGIVGIRFISKYIDAKTKLAVSKYVFGTCMALYILVIFFALINQHQVAYQILQPAASLAALSVLIVTSIIYYRGSQTAGNVLLAWGVFLIGIVIFVLKDFEIVPFNTFTYNVMTIGSALEGILLSFGLADRINTLKKEKEQAQERELEALKANEQKLEQKVIERTSELEMAKNEVQRNYDHLRITQRQLVEAEKLSGLGQMTAGIAHELNNPINFVSSNIAPLNRDVDEVIKFMNEFEKLPEHTTQEQLDDLKAKYKDADMPYVKQEIDQLMKGISEGARRTAEIVKGLRIFARADRDALVKSNINECMDATLVVMKSTYKDDITLVKDLDPAIPELECFPGKLNQVFANLIGNAVHATRAMGRPKEQQFIWIKTWADNDNLYVSIKDNGKGMTDEVKAKIFEPFYTTKGVGEGTGLGLSISHGIIEEHKGTVSVNTKINEGTEFIIAIPRNLAQIRNLAA